MKNLFRLLLFTLVFYSCNQKPNDSSGNITDSSASGNLRDSSNENYKPVGTVADPCIYCDPVKEPDHTYSAEDAAQLIMDFQIEFNGKIKYFGGTIYGDIDYFTLKMADLVSYNAIKFHLCGTSDKGTVVCPPSDNSTVNFFLALDNDVCNSGVGTPGVRALNCKKSSNNNMFDRFQNITTLDQYISKLVTHRKINGGGNQDIIYNNPGNNLITLSKDYLKCRNIFNINCSNYESYFSRNNTVEQIFSDPDCKGIRYYYGLDRKDTNSTIKIILVGVNNNGANLYRYRETSRPHS